MSHQREAPWNSRVGNAVRGASANQQTKTSCLWARKQLLFLLSPACESQDVPFPLCPGVRHGSAGNDRKVGGQGLQP